MKKMGSWKFVLLFLIFEEKSTFFTWQRWTVPLLLAVFSRNSTAKCIKFAPCYDPSMMTRPGNGWRPRVFPIQVGQHDSCCIDLKLLKPHEISWNAGSIFMHPFGFKLDKRFSLAPFAVGFGIILDPVRRQLGVFKEETHYIFLKKPT